MQNFKSKKKLEVKISDRKYQFNQGKEFTPFALSPKRATSKGDRMVSIIPARDRVTKLTQ